MHFTPKTGGEVGVWAAILSHNKTVPMKTSPSRNYYDAKVSQMAIQQLVVLWSRLLVQENGSTAIYWRLGKIEIFMSQANYGGGWRRHHWNPHSRFAIAK